MSLWNAEKVPEKVLRNFIVIFRNIKVRIVFILIFILAGIWIIGSGLGGALFYFGSVGSFEKETNCLKIGSWLTLAQRTGKKSCWARFRLSRNRLFCITKDQWLEGLKSPLELEFCPDDRKVKTFAHLQNQSVQGQEGRNRKEIFLLHRAILRRSLPDEGKGFSSEFWLAPVLKKIKILIIYIEIKRERLSSRIQKTDSFGIFRSLLISERDSSDSISVLRRLGFVHLASATGIHLYALGSTVNWGLRQICEKTSVPVGVGLWVNRLSCFLVCFWIWLLSGARFGMLRPVWVILLRQLTLLLGLRWKKGYPLAVTFFTEVIVAPLLPYPIYSGKLVYALAVGGGMVGVEFFGMRSKLNPFKTHLALAMGSWVFPALWEAWESGTLALATPLLSLVTLPVLCLGVYPILIMGLILESVGGIDNLDQRDFSIFAMIRGCSFVFENLIKISLSPGNLMMISSLSLFCAGLIVLVGFILRTRIEDRFHFFSKFLVFLAFLRFFTSGALTLKNRKSNWVKADQVEQLDVGQGDAALISFRMGVLSQRSVWGRMQKSHFGMIDAGSFRSLREDQWIEILAKRKISQISWVVLTHLDEDHVGGLFKLATLLPISTVIASRAEWNSERGLALKQKMEELNLRIQNESSNEIPFPVFAIQPKLKCIRRCANRNMLSIVIPLQSGGTYFSLGDASSVDEEKILFELNRFIENEGAPRILKVSHHGSRTSSSIQFLRKLKPDQAWISVGFGNRYGHPAPEVLDKFESLDIPVSRTDRDGALKLISS